MGFIYLYFLKDYINCCVTVSVNQDIENVIDRYIFGLAELLLRYDIICWVRYQIELKLFSKKISTFISIALSNGERNNCASAVVVF